MSELLTIIVILAGVWFSSKISAWYDQWRLGKLRITFNNFLDYYAVNPNRFRLDDCLYTRINDRWVYFKFNFFDYMRYKHFVKHREKTCKMQADNDTMAQFLELVMQDIQEKQAIAAAERQKAVEDLSKRCNQINI